MRRNSKQDGSSWKRAARTGVALVMIVAMVFSMGFFPGGKVSAGSLLSAKVPARYAKGYNIYRAIDISAWQGNLTKKQFQRIRALGITHVFLRSSYTRLHSFTLRKDKCFSNNIVNAHAAGLKVGVYHYSQAKTVSEAKKEAAYTLRVIRPYRSKISLPVVFDDEFGSRLNSRHARKIGKTAMTNIAIAYCKKVKAAGYSPMIYASASFLKGYLKRDTLHAKYPIWVAHYTRGARATDYSRPITMWQYSSSGRLNDPKTGKAIVKGRIDMNYIFIKKGKKNKWTPVKVKSTKKKSSASSTKFRVKTIGSLNVRTGPAKTYKKVKTLKKGTKVTIVQTKNRWGKIKKNQWISLKYTKRL